jgi:hypothetical protein
MNRTIAVKLYNEMVAIRPSWHSSSDAEGQIKVIMTGSSSDDDFLRPHIRNKEGRTKISNRLKNEQDPLKMVIVVDMWLTGFDAPILHTLYLDKDMSGHNLMQAIARVNRVFRDKPGGLIVDYVPNNPGLITLVVIDHIGLIGYNNYKDLKEAIDKASRTLVFFRNMFNFSPVVISQINRSSEQMDRRENDSWMPMLSDIKNTGNVAEDCNTAIGIASPFYYGVDKCLGYDITKFKNRYRLAKICKNRDGDVNLLASFLFIGEFGGYYQLPKAEDMMGKPEELRKIDEYYRSLNS